MIKFVICGMEHSGTTLLSDLFRQLPQVDSGFEVGVLLAATPAEFPTVQPFFGNLPGSWKVSDQAARSACAEASSFEDFYHRLYRDSELFNPDVSALFDKTPRYLQQLQTCMERLPVPYFLTYKDPRSLISSDFKRHGNDENFGTWYEGFAPGKLQYMKGAYSHYSNARDGLLDGSERVFPVSLEQICMDTRSTLDAAFAHVGYEFKPEYLLLKDLRYPHTLAADVSTNVPFRYRDHLDAAAIAMIEDDFGQFGDWFYG